MRTRTRVAVAAIGLVAGLLVIGLAAARTTHSATRAAAGMAAHATTAPSSPGNPRPAGHAATRDATNVPLHPAGASRSSRSSSPASTQSAGSAPSSGSSASQPSPSPATTTTTSSPSYYTILSKAHSLCLNAMSTANTAQVDVYGCNNSWYQDWTGIKAGSAEEIVNKESGLCLSARSFAKGADVIIETCKKTDNQLWLPDGDTLRLDTTSSGICLGADSSGTNESPAGAPACASSTVQEWTW